MGCVEKKGRSSASGIIQGIRWCDFCEPELNRKYHILSATCPQDSQTNPYFSSARPQGMV